MYARIILARRRSESEVAKFATYFLPRVGA
jgi:hypothetical protein